MTAVVGADIYTVTRGMVRGGVVLIQDGKIIQIGQDVPIPDGATRIDAAGKVVTPGFIAVSATGVAVACDLTLQILAALDYAHANGVIHGALSPRSVVTQTRGAGRFVFLFQKRLPQAGRGTAHSAHRGSTPRTRALR